VDERQRRAPFAIERYGQVIDAYVRGPTPRAFGGELLPSVASFFLSRIDSKVDAQLSDRHFGVASRFPSARVAYRRYVTRFAPNEAGLRAGPVRARLAPRRAFRPSARAVGRGSGQR